MRSFWKYFGVCVALQTNKRALFHLTLCTICGNNERNFYFKIWNISCVSWLGYWGKNASQRAGANTFMSGIMWWDVTAAGPNGLQVGEGEEQTSACINDIPTLEKLEYKACDGLKCQAYFLLLSLAAKRQRTSGLWQRGGGRGVIVGKGNSHLLCKDLSAKATTKLTLMLD